MRQKVSLCGNGLRNFLSPSLQVCFPYSYKVCNKETNELMDGRNIRSGWDLNQGRLDEKPVPQPLS